MSKIEDIIKRKTKERFKVKAIFVMQREAKCEAEITARREGNLSRYKMDGEHSVYNPRALSSLLSNSR